jgi:hypothetical protein
MTEFAMNPFKIRRTAAALVLCFAVSIAAHAQAAAEKPEAKAQRHIDALSWLVGGVWTADATKLGPGMLRIETRYQWSDNGSYIRFTTHFVTTARELKNYDGNLFWNPTDQKLAAWYMDAGNSITQGPMAVDGELWQIWFDGQDFEGKQASLRVQVARKSADLYTWTLAEKQGEDWKQLATLDYARK